MSWIGKKRTRSSVKYPPAHYCIYVLAFQDMQAPIQTDRGLWLTLSSQVHIFERALSLAGFVYQYGRCLQRFLVHSTMPSHKELMPHGIKRRIYQ